MVLRLFPLVCTNFVVSGFIWVCLDKDEGFGLETCLNPLGFTFSSVFQLRFIYWKNCILGLEFHRFLTQICFRS